jgi:hypothetical protein
MVYAGLSAEQLKRPCANCKQLGHWARECPEEDHRGEDNGADAQPDQLEDEKDTSTTNVAKAAPSKKKGGKSGKKNAYRMRADSYDDFDDIFGFAATSPKALGNMDPFLVCIDSLANMSFTFNEKLLRNMRGKHLDVTGFHGKGTTDAVGSFPGFGEAIYAPDCGATGLALCEIEQRYKVTYVQRTHILVKINDDLTLVFNYDATIGAYACLFGPRRMFVCFDGSGQVLMKSGGMKLVRDVKVGDEVCTGRGGSNGTCGIDHDGFCAPFWSGNVPHQWFVGDAGPSSQMGAGRQ